MAPEIHLNGGPMHGMVMAIEEDQDHFHVLQPDPNQPIPDDPEAEFTAVREGMYSKVQGYPGEYEWDGWVSCDDR